MQAAQNPLPPGANSTTKSSSTAGIFGTTADFESGIQTKGAELGNAKTEKQNGTKGEFAFAPIPLLNPSVGNGMGAAVMYLKPLDASAATPPSTFAIAGFGTGNGSWGVGFGTKLYLKDDLYRITAGYGGGAFNYNFFGIGSDSGSQGLAIPFSQRSRAYLIEPTRRFFGNWYIGPRYHHISNHITLDQDKLKAQFGGNLPPDFAHHLAVPLPDGLNLTTAALGLSVKRDTTDSAFYPRSGSLLDITIDFFDRAFGAELSYQNVNVAYNKYINLGRKNVLATHLASCVVTNRAPFFDVCLLGQSKDLRGYQVGQYRDNRMLDGQAELRRELFWRFGAAVFFGLGEVAKTFGDFNSSNLVPGGGIGLRYELAKKNHINLRADYAWGKDSRAFYMSVGEAF
jgi:Omp85 superfamily domain